MGATGEYITRSGKKIHIHLASNPSHLEAVDPVTIGRTRAKQDRAGEGGKAKYLPVLVHGDAAFAGQGITAETMTTPTWLATRSAERSTSSSTT